MSSPVWVYLVSYRSRFSPDGVMVATYGDAIVRLPNPVKDERSIELIRAQLAEKAHIGPDHPYLKDSYYIEHGFVGPNRTGLKILISSAPAISGAFFFFTFSFSRDKISPLITDDVRFSSLRATTRSAAISGLLRRQLLAMTSQMQERNFWLALAQVEHIGAVRFKLLVDYFGSAEKVWSLPAKELATTGLPKNAVGELIKAQQTIDPNQIVKEVTEKNINFVCSFEESFPKLLKEIADCPPVLFYQGEIINLERPIAVVGTRKPSTYGKTVTEKLTSELVQAGFTIISGLALGVDAIAHRVALEMKGRTVAVLGSGVDKVSPQTNVNLGKKILESGGAVVAEYWPGTESNVGTFPARNRIISGLSLGVLVTEGAEDSGSLITARAALEQNREVFAVPGPITSSLSAGPANLIKQGAKLVTSMDDILEELNGVTQNLKPQARNLEEMRFENEIEKKIYLCLVNEEKPIDDIVRETCLNSQEVITTLTLMELKGLIRSSANKNYFVN